MADIMGDRLRRDEVICDLVRMQEGLRSQGIIRNIRLYESTDALAELRDQWAKETTMADTEKASSDVSVAEKMRALENRRRLVVIEYQDAVSMLVHATDQRRKLGNEIAALDTALDCLRGLS